MRFWDSSALLPLLIDEETSDRLKARLREDPRASVWWASRVECASALARRTREGRLTDAALAVAWARLDSLAGSWLETFPDETVRDRALRLLRIHPLRAGDALQLSAALTACDDRPRGMGLVTLDARLAQAARREGFDVLD